MIKKIACYFVYNRFKSSTLFGTHTLLDQSFRVLQLPTHLCNFVWLEALTMLINNPINIYLINLKAFLCRVLFIKYL